MGVGRSELPAAAAARLVLRPQSLRHHPCDRLRAHRGAEQRHRGVADALLCVADPSRARGGNEREGGVAGGGPGGGGCSEARDEVCPGFEEGDLKARERKRSAERAAEVSAQRGVCATPRSVHSVVACGTLASRATEASRTTSAPSALKSETTRP